MAERRMRTFFVVWSGQFVSLIGTSLTGFALSVFVYLETGSATQLSLVLLASQLPMIVFTPVAGALVDRWDRRVAMMVSDGGAGAVTLVIAALVASDTLEIWHLFPLLAVQSTFQTLQWPAYSAATTLLVPKAQYGRAAGLVQLAEAASQVVAPALAGVILVVGGLASVLAIDVVSFVVAVGTLAMVRFPEPVRAAETGSGSSLLDDTRFGVRYLRDRPGLLALLGYFAVLNLVFGYIGVVFYPLVLGFATEQALGTVLTVAATGMIAGSLTMSVWGGPRRRIMGVLAGDIGLSVALVAVGLRPSLVLITCAAFVGFFTIPIANGSSQALWQAKVEPAVQGRVFAIRRTLAQIATPIALISAGPLLDRLFQPLMDDDGALAGSVGSLIGTGAGRGAALFLIVLGIAGVAAGIVAYAYPRLRLVDEELPDAVPA